MMNNASIIKSLARTLMISILIFSITIGIAFAQTTGYGRRNATEEASPTGAIIGAGILLVLLVVFTVIVQKRGAKKGCPGCACGNNEDEACENPENPGNK